MPAPHHTFLFWESRCRDQGGPCLSFLGQKDLLKQNLLKWQNKGRWLLTEWTSVWVWQSQAGAGEMLGFVNTLLTLTSVQGGPGDGPEMGPHLGRKFHISHRCWTEFQWKVKPTQQEAHPPDLSMSRLSPTHRSHSCLVPTWNLQIP